MVLHGPVKALSFVHVGLCGQLPVFCVHLHLWDTRFAVWRHPQIGKVAKHTGEEKLLGSSNPLDSASPSMMLFRISFGKCCFSLGECISAW